MTSKKELLLLWNYILLLHFIPTVCYFALGFFTWYIYLWLLCDHILLVFSTFAFISRSPQLLWLINPFRQKPYLWSVASLYWSFFLIHLWASAIHDKNLNLIFPLGHGKKWIWGLLLHIATVNRLLYKTSWTEEVKLCYNQWAFNWLYYF